MRILKESITRDEAYDEIHGIIDGMDGNSQVYLWNEYCSEVGYDDDMLYSMDDLDELLSGAKPWDVLRMAFYGDFKPVDDFWRFDGYGNLESFSYVSDFVDVDDITSFILDENNPLGNNEIEAILDELNENGEDDE